MHVSSGRFNEPARERACLSGTRLCPDDPTRLLAEWSLQAGGQAANEVPVPSPGVVPPCTAGIGPHHDSQTDLQAAAKASKKASAVSVISLSWIVLKDVFSQ